MVHIVGAGPGAEDLITVRGLKFFKNRRTLLFMQVPWLIRVC